MKNRKIRQIRMELLREESLPIVIEIAITRICHIMLMKRKRKRSMLILAWYGGGQIMIITDLCTVQLPDSVIGGSNPKKKRDFVLVELLETEANYVDVLNRLRKNF